MCRGIREWRLTQDKRTPMTLFMQHMKKKDPPAAVEISKSIQPKKRKATTTDQRKEIGT